MLWQPDHTIGGQAEYAVVQIPTGMQLLPPPELGADMKAFIRERIARKATKKKPGEYIYYNWLKPYDWIRGTITKQAGKQANTVRVTFEKGPSCKRAYTANVLLEPAQYGIRKRWVITTPSE